MDGYRTVRCLAEGRFGTVFEAVREATGERVAVKRVRARRPMPGLGYDPWRRSAEREVQVLGALPPHAHVVELLAHCLAAQGTAVLVYEYLAWDLAAVLERSCPMDEGCAKVAFRMLLLGVVHLHANGVMHRDLKPANLLVEGGSGVLKIADFGSSRATTAASASAAGAAGGGGCAEEPLSGMMTRDVCTRWYKAPELLFGSVDYAPSVDLWAAGCVLADLLSLGGQAAFPGGSDIEQLCLVFQTLGTPDEEDWPEVRALPDYHKVEFRPRAPEPLELEAGRSAGAGRLLRRLLRLNPARRSAATDALDDPWFAADPPLPAPSRLILGLGEGAPGIGEAQDFDDEFGGGSASSDASIIVGGAGDDGSCSEGIAVETTRCGLWADECAPGSWGAESPRGASPEAAPAADAAPLAPAAASPAVRARELDAAAAGAGGAPGAAAARWRTPSPPPPGGHRLKAGR